MVLCIGDGNGEHSIVPYLCGGDFKQEKVMKIQDLIRDTRFTLVGDGSHTVFRLDRIDADFAVCYLGDAAVHISVGAEVKEVRDETK